jgi:hypothetical protein
MIAALSLSPVLVRADAVPQAADVIIMGIGLLDSASAHTVLGPTIKTSGLPVPHAVYHNLTSKERLILRLYPGANQGEFASYEVTEAARGDKAPALKKVAFISGKGIRLGMSRSQVTAILGAPVSDKETEGEDVLGYALTDSDAYEFFRKYNQTVYTSEYHFRDDKLRKFSAGFIYP